MKHENCKFFITHFITNREVRVKVFAENPKKVMKHGTKILFLSMFI